MQDKYSSGGWAERTIMIFAGLIMGSIGGASAWLCYLTAMYGSGSQYGWVIIAASGTFAFLLLRGAWFALFVRPKEDRIKLSHEL